MARVMASSKKALELVFSLHWQKSDNCDDKSNIIGMYDTPVTTLNFETFKSYLLKNSGIAANDVKVTYVTDDNCDWIIDDEALFQKALPIFRLKARLSEVILLKLNKNLGAIKRPQMIEKESSDVQTQFDNKIEVRAEPPEWFLGFMDDFRRDLIDELTAVIQNSVSVPREVFAHSSFAEVPANLSFEEASAGLSLEEVSKHSLFEEASAELSLEEVSKHSSLEEASAELSLEEVSKHSSLEEASVEPPLKEVSVQSPIKEVSAQSPLKEDSEDSFISVGSLHRLSKDDDMRLPEFLVRKARLAQARKNSACQGPKTFVLNPILKRTLKYDHKIDLKLDSLAAKTNKLQRQREALLISKASINRTIKDNLGENWNEVLSVKVLSSLEVVHLMGGESYIRTWTVMNDGKLRWPESTYLRLEWGTSGLTPSAESFGCVCLNPDEQVDINVLFNVTETPGNYESYWSFFNSGRRFGQSLSFRANVSLPYDDFSLRYFKLIDHTTDTMPATMVEKPACDIKVQTVHSTELDLPSKPDHAKSMENDGKVFKRPLTSPMWSPRYITESVKSRFEDSETDSDPELNTNGRVKYGISEEDLIVDMSAVHNSVKSKTVKEDNYRDTDDMIHDLKIKDDAENEQTNRDTDGASDASSAKSEDEFSIVSAHDISENSIHTLENSEHDDSEDSSLESEGEAASATQSDHQDNNNNGESITSDADISNNSYDVINVPVPEENEDDAEFVIVHCGSSDVKVPKSIVRPEFLVQLETSKESADNDEADCSFSNVRTSSPELNASTELSDLPKLEEVSYLGTNSEHSSFVSHCSNAGTCCSELSAPQYTPRKFVFPEEASGYELVTPKTVEKVLTSVVTEAVMSLPNDVRSPFLQPIQPADTYVMPNYQPAGDLPYTSTHRIDLPASYSHVPNYQQTPRDQRRQEYEEFLALGRHYSPETPTQTLSPPHILPTNFVNSAVSVASSALSTARSVINMMIPPKPESGKWVNGHWEIENPDSKRARNLKIMAEMGFWDQDLNATLLARYNDDVSRAVSELLQ